MKKETNCYKTSKIIESVKKLQNEYPEAVYRSNMVTSSDDDEHTLPSTYWPTTCDYFAGYVKNGPKTKGCLIGQAISAAYPSLRKEIKLRGDTNLAIGEVISVYNISGSARDKARLIRVQYNQDQEVCWSKCHTNQKQKYYDQARFPDLD